MIIKINSAETLPNKCRGNFVVNKVAREERIFKKRKPFEAQLELRRDDLKGGLAVYSVS